MKVTFLHSVTLSNVIPDTLCTTREGSSHQIQQCIKTGWEADEWPCTDAQQCLAPGHQGWMHHWTQFTNNQQVPCLHSVIYLEKSQLLWQKQPCQLVENLCTERTDLLLPELSSHAKFFPALPWNSQFVSSSSPKCSPASFMCIPPEGGPFQAKQATQGEISGSTVHSAYLCPCHCKNWEHLTRWTSPRGNPGLSPPLL